ncbi:two-partner secretion domain-containing protein, partial [Pseudomonas huaxiensis]|uniref:two-partner secretion domain-containing protein n=1 Tax=Pseudomonas huaxiensis TaxID=2213017 RepID=UPI0013005289
DVAAGNKVTFNQPGRDSIALNRVLGADGSKIMGQLDANGRVFIVNPNGVLFGQGAQVNVGGLVASTLDISNSDFEAGNYAFKGNGKNAAVTNSGKISATDGGSVALLGGTVSNNGVIVANQGSVALAAGNKVTLDFAGDGLLNVQVDEAVVDALVENHQLIKADGGQVLLTANAGEALINTVVNNTGAIEAQTVGEKNGKIVLLGSFDGGSVQVAGTLDASAPSG